MKNMSQRSSQQSSKKPGGKERTHLSNTSKTKPKVINGKDKPSVTEEGESGHLGLTLKINVKTEFEKNSNNVFYADIPKRVRIGSMWFRIDVSEPGDSEIQGEFGHFNLISQRIRVRSGQSPQSLANTFLHEVLHAIHWVYGLFRNEPDEEHYTNQTANGLCAFFQDNPEATQWLLRTNELKQ